MSQQPLAQSDQKPDQSNPQQNNQNQHNNSVGKTQLPQRNLLLRIALYIKKFFHLLIVLFKGFYLIFSIRFIIDAIVKKIVEVTVEKVSEKKKIGRRFRE